ncbi:oxidoreductase C-terminal domain-containing protein [Nocardioides gansuensis]
MRARRCRPLLAGAALDRSRRLRPEAARTPSGLPLEDDVTEDHFWSHQGELRLMSVGHPPKDVAPRITSGHLESGKFVPVWDVDGRVTAVLGANSPREFLRGRLAFRASFARPSL